VLWAEVTNLYHFNTDLKALEEDLCSASGWNDQLRFELMLTAHGGRTGYLLLTLGANRQSPIGIIEVFKFRLTGTDMKKLPIPFFKQPGSSARREWTVHYRYNPDTDNAPYMQDVQFDTGGKDLMVLGALELLKAQDPSIAYRRSCREGVFGSGGMNMNGKNDLAGITAL